MTEPDLVAIVVAALEDIKGIDVQVIDVRELTDVTDHIVIASGATGRQVRALADNALEKAKAAGFRPIGVEGKDVGDWVLLDFGWVVVHVMHPDTRSFYDLERLWSVAASRRES